MKSYYQVQYQGFLTLTGREIRRFLRIWVQTLLPTVVTVTLYFIVFGTVLGAKATPPGQMSYTEFMTPGLIMMGMINNAFSNVVSSFFGSKFQKHIEEVIIAPLETHVVMAGFIVGGVVRGLLVGVITLAVAQAFDPHVIVAPGLCLLLSLLITIFFSLAGLLNAIYAQKFDDISLIPNFILTPMIYLGGVFYNASQVTGFLKFLTKINPIYYVIESFRYALLGSCVAPANIAYIILIPGNIILWFVVLNLLYKRRGMGA
jgi:ABC-2 type transport system permease protein